MSVSLENIVGGQRLKPPKVVLYGVGGIGKTTFAAAAPDPIFIFTEEGQGRMPVKRFELRDEDPVIRTWTELMECIGALYQGGHDYKTVVIDTLDFAEPMLWKHTAQEYNEESIESFGYGKGYVYATDFARVLLEGLDALRNERKMSIVLLAHSDTEKHSAPDAEPYDRYKLRLHKRFGNLVHDWCDAMLFANWRTHIVKDKDPKARGKDAASKERARGVGTGERVVYTEERPAWWAKNRYGLPFEMPLSWAALQDGIAAGVEAGPASAELPKPTEPKPNTENSTKAKAGTEKQ